MLEPHDVNGVDLVVAALRKVRVDEGDEAVLVTAQEIIYGASTILAREAGNAYSLEVLANAGKALKRSVSCEKAPILDHGAFRSARAAPIGARHRPPRMAPAR
jgi:hypothetical protein